MGFIDLELFREHRWLLPLGFLAAVGLAWLMLYRLGSLPGGVSLGEQRAAAAVYGWHGLYHQPLNLPLDFVRSLVFAVFRHHGQTLTRLPNAVFGGLTIVTFAGLLRFWYGGRTAILAAILFACSAWTLHVSRLASTDILYLWATPTLLLSQLALQRRSTWAVVFYGCLVVWLALLFVPGMVWLVALSVIWSRGALARGWQYFTRWWQRGLYGLIGLPFLAFLGLGLSRPGVWRTWLGLPQHLAMPLTIFRQFAAVPFHLFVKGPALPALWLGRVPILDVFTLMMTLVGIYFYARHWQTGRSRLLAACFGVGWLLVALGGPVGLSVLVPLLYLCAAAGIAYLLRDWLRTFPLNPLARGFGIGLVTLAVVLSAGYNLRAYFQAWPHDPATQAVFRYRV